MAFDDRYGFIDAKAANVIAEALEEEGFGNNIAVASTIYAALREKGYLDEVVLHTSEQLTAVKLDEDEAKSLLKAARADHRVDIIEGCPCATCDGLRKLRDLR